MQEQETIGIQEYFDMPNPGLLSYFSRTREGSSTVIRTPFYEGDTSSSVLGRWQKQLTARLSQRWPSLLEFENDLASKVGPLSFQKPLSERLEDIGHYYEDILLPQKPVPENAIASVLHEWKDVVGFTVRDQQSTLERMKLSTSSGNPFYSKKRKVIDRTVPCYVRFYDDNRIYQHLNFRMDSETSWRCGALLGWRGQEGGPDKEDVKQRVVWMFPFAVNLQELRVYQVLIEKAQKYNLIPPWNGFSYVDQRITDLFDTKSPDQLLICTDFSKFDQHFGPACQNAAEEILSRLLRNNHGSKGWLENVFPIKYHIPMIVDYDEQSNNLLLYKGQHGMGSGSGGTNADETLVHRALQYAAAQSIGSHLNPNSMCLGDDGILTYPGITVDNVVKTYTQFGLEMNETKQYVSTDDCVFLRHWHHSGYRINGVCVGVYSSCRALGKLMYMERFHPDWSKEMVALRQLSILENCRYHPMRDEFADYCMKGDKYRLGLDIPGFLDNLEKTVQGIGADITDFMNYNQQQDYNNGEHPINEWWIVNYLRSRE